MKCTLRQLMRNYGGGALCVDKHSCFKDN